MRMTLQVAREQRRTYHAREHAAANGVEVDG